MKKNAKNVSYFSRLSAALAGQKNALADLLHRLVGMGPTDGMKGSVFRKFLRTLEQISFEKEKELELIHRIEAVETRHRIQRKHKKLKRAAHHRAKKKVSQNKPIFSEPEAERSGAGWLGIAAYICLLSGNGLKPRD